MNININVLQKGDEVLSVFNYRDNVAISVKRKQGAVDVVLLDKNVEGIPQITSTWTIGEGDNEVVVSNDNVKISTF
jgi:hypothetical protein